MHSSKKLKRLKNKQSISFQYIKLRTIQTEELAKERLRLIAALYGHFIESGEKTLLHYNYLTMADLSEEIQIRTIMMRQKRLRAENKEQEKEKPQQRGNKLLDQIMKETSGG